MAAIDAGIHTPDFMPFSVAWTDLPPETRQRESAQYWWRQRAEWKPDGWNLDLAVFLDGEAIGGQSVKGRNFTVLREVETGSWLTLAAQGRGLGKEMRAAALQLVFEGLGAEVARSAAFVDNGPSLGVSRALGYRENGTYREAPRGSPREGVRLELSRREWEARRDGLPRAEITGLDECSSLFGIPGA